VNRRELAWASFDWANSAFPTVVSTFVIAAYFTKGIAPDPVSGQAMWGWMQALTGVALGLLSPLLGAVADAGGRRRALLGVFTVLTALATAAIWFARPVADDALYALACVALGTLCFELGTVFYNAMLPEVTSRERIGRVSGIGWALGYMGGLACLVLCLVVLVQPDPPRFGLDKAQAEPVRATALLVGAWLLVFALPLLVMAPPERASRPWGVALRDGIVELFAVVRGLPRRPELLRFILARLFYTDGLNVLFSFGAVFAAGAFGMGFEEILLFGIALNVTGGVGAFAGGFVEERLGARRTVVVSLVALMLLGAGGAFRTVRPVGPGHGLSRPGGPGLAPPAASAAWPWCWCCCNPRHRAPALSLRTSPPAQRLHHEAELAGGRARPAPPASCSPAGGRRSPPARSGAPAARRWASSGTARTSTGQLSEPISTGSWRSATPPRRRRCPGSRGRSARCRGPRDGPSRC
jgi:UMF1 family MFS transporter